MVSNARAAVSILAEQRFDLLFADVKLPDMDGFELVRNIRPDHPQLPCVLVSGFYYNNDDAVQNALSDRLVIGYLSKPFPLRPVQEDYPACFDLLSDMEKSSLYAPSDRNAPQTSQVRSARHQVVRSREFTPD